MRISLCGDVAVAVEFEPLWKVVRLQSHSDKFSITVKMSPFVAAVKFDLCAVEDVLRVALFKVEIAGAMFGWRYNRLVSASVHDARIAVSKNFRGQLLVRHGRTAASFRRGFESEQFFQARAVAFAVAFRGWFRL